MRDRHWKMLMQTTGKHFVMDEKFCLGDLLALGLHNYVDACRCVVVVWGRWGRAELWVWTGNQCVRSREAQPAYSSCYH